MKPWNVMNTSLVANIPAFLQDCSQRPKQKSVFRLVSCSHLGSSALLFPYFSQLNLCSVRTWQWFSVRKKHIISYQDLLMVPQFYENRGDRPHRQCFSLYETLSLWKLGYHPHCYSSQSPSLCLGTTRPILPAGCTWQGRKRLYIAMFMGGVISSVL